jgi:hypothetical protein
LGVEEVGGAITSKAVPEVGKAIEAESLHTSLNGPAKKLRGDRGRQVEGGGRRGSKKGVGYTCWHEEQ